MRLRIRLLGAIQATGFIWGSQVYKELVGPTREFGSVLTLRLKRYLVAFSQGGLGLQFDDIKIVS